MTARFTVTVRQVLDDGSEVPLEGEVAAALAAPAEQFAGLAAWAADEARYLDHGEREKVIGDEGRELQRLVLQAAFDIDAAREERAAGVTSAAGIGHGIVRGPADLRHRPFAILRENGRRQRRRQARPGRRQHRRVNRVGSA